MAGLLDSLTAALGGEGLDTNGKAALNQGLLTMGLSMLASPGKFGQQLGQGGLQGMQAYQGAQQMQRRNAMGDLQMQQAQMQMEAEKRRNDQMLKDQQLTQQAFAPVTGPQALAQGGGPTPQNAQAIGQQPKFDPWNFVGQGGSLEGAKTAFDLQQSMQKPRFLTVKKDEALLDPTSLKPVFDNIQPDTELGKLQRLRSQLPQGDPRIPEINAAILKATTHTPPVNVSVSMDKGFGEKFATDAAANLGASRDRAQAAVKTLQSLDQVESAVNSGLAITGPMANWKTVGLRIAQQMGIGGKDAEETLANTANLVQGQAKLAVNGAAMLAGQGQITDGERALINRAAGGELQSMTAPEIKVLIGAMRKVNQQAITQHQDALKKVPGKFQEFAPFYQVDMPTPTGGNGWSITPKGGR